MSIEIFWVLLNFTAVWVIIWTKPCYLNVWGSSLNLMIPKRWEAGCSKIQGLARLISSALDENLGMILDAPSSNKQSFRERLSGRYRAVLDVVAVELSSKEEWRLETWASSSEAGRCRQKIIWLSKTGTNSFSIYSLIIQQIRCLKWASRLRVCSKGMDKCEVIRRLSGWSEQGNLDWYVDEKGRPSGMWDRKMSTN